MVLKIHNWTLYAGSVKWKVQPLGTCKLSEQEVVFKAGLTVHVKWYAHAAYV